MFPCELAREALRLACLPRPQPAGGEGEGDEDEDSYEGESFEDDEDADEDAEEDLDAAFGGIRRFAMAGAGGDGDAGDMAGAAR